MSQYEFRFYYQLLGWIFLLIFIITIVILGSNKVAMLIYNIYSNSLDYIILTGERRYTTNSDIQYVFSKIGTLETFIQQDVNIIQQQIQYLPWVMQVSVRKKWPDSLKIHVIEYIPIACWNDMKRISTTGVVFSVPESHNEVNLHVFPFLYGPEGREKDVLNIYYIFNAILKSNGLQIKSVKMDIWSSWNLVVQDKIHLKLGRNDIIERLCYFIKIYPVLLHEMSEKNKYIDYIDFRYHSGCAIRWISNAITPVFSKNNTVYYKHD